MQPILQSHSLSVLPSTVTFHQMSLPGRGGVHCPAILGCLVKMQGLQMTDCISTAVLKAVLKIRHKLFRYKTSTTT